MPSAWPSYIGRAGLPSYAIPQYHFETLNKHSCTATSWTLSSTLDAKTGCASQRLSSLWDTVLNHKQLRSVTQISHS
eukprot:2471393-Amphidinium_carterae.1